MKKVLSRARLKLGRMKEVSNKIMGDKRKVNTAQEIRKILTDKEYNEWIKRLSKGGSPEEQKSITAEYAQKIGKYDEWNSLARLE